MKNKILKSHYNRKGGFSLVEFVSYTAVLAIVLGTVVFFTISLVRNERAFTNRLSVIDEVEYAMRQITDKTRTSIEIFPENDSSTPSKFSNTSLAKCSTNCVLYLATSTEPLYTKFMVNGDGNLEIVEDWRISGVVNKKVRPLTSSKVSIDEFIVECIGSSEQCGGSSPVPSVRIRIKASNRENENESESITTSVTLRVL